MDVAGRILTRIDGLGAEPPLQGRIGIDTGEVAVGNFGSQNRSD